MCIIIYLYIYMYIYIYIYYSLVKRKPRKEPFKGHHSGELPQGPALLPQQTAELPGWQTAKLAQLCLRQTPPPIITPPVRRHYNHCDIHCGQAAHNNRMSFGDTW